MPQEKKTVVAANLPQVPTRVSTGEDGIEYEVVTYDEALTEILNTVRELKKVWGK